LFPTDYKESWVLCCEQKETNYYKYSRVIITPMVKTSAMENKSVENL